MIEELKLEEQENKENRDIITPIDNPTTLEAQIYPLPQKNDTWINSITDELGIPSTVYYYAIDGEQIRENQHKGFGTWIPPNEAVLSVSYNPYIDVSTDLKRFQTNYDIRRFPLGSVQDPGNIDVKVAPQFRVERQLAHKKPLFSFNPFGHVSRIGGPGKKRNWRNEGKLWQFPYQYGVLDDGLMEPLDFKYHLCDARFNPGNGNYESTVGVVAPITMNGTYKVHIFRYADDMTGIMYGSTNNRSPQLPISASSYTSYMAGAKAQNAAKKSSAIISGAIGVAGAVAGAVAAPFTGGASLALSAGALIGGLGSVANSYNTIKQVNAQEKDMMDVPGRLLNRGNDGLFDIQSTMLHDNKTSGLFLIRMAQTTEKMEQIGDFFAMYGYAQKKTMRPNLRNRYFYNYIKTVGANISCKDGVGIPKEHFQKLKAIFDNGTTIWHITRAGVNVGDYSMDNYEV